MNTAEIQRYVAAQLEKALKNSQTSSTAQSTELDAASQQAIAAGVEAGIRLATQGATAEQLQAGIQQAMHKAPERQAQTENRIKSLKLAGVRAAMESLTYSQQRQVEEELFKENQVAIAAGAAPTVRLQWGHQLSNSEKLIMSQAELSVLQRFDQNPLRQITLLDNCRTLKGWIAQGRQ